MIRLAKVKFSTAWQNWSCIHLSAFMRYCYSSDKSKLMIDSTQDRNTGSFTIVLPFDWFYWYMELCSMRFIVRARCVSSIEAEKMYSHCWCSESTNSVQYTNYRRRSVIVHAVCGEKYSRVNMRWIRSINVFFSFIYFVSEVKLIESPISFDKFPIYIQPLVLVLVRVCIMYWCRSTLKCRFVQINLI